MKGNRALVTVAITLGALFFLAFLVLSLRRQAQTRATGLAGLVGAGGGVLAGLFGPSKGTTGATYVNVGGGAGGMVPGFSTTGMLDSLSGQTYMGASNDWQANNLGGVFGATAAGGIGNTPETAAWTPGLKAGGFTMGGDGGSAPLDMAVPSFDLGGPSF